MSHDPHDQIHFEAPSLEEVESLLPNYKFESFIAKGGMGAVYKATQISLDRPVAIKILPTEFGDDENFRESFQTEAKLMARLNHPNLIGVYDFGEIEGMLYIVMEYVPGKTLYEKVYGKAIKQDLAIEIIKQICEGLEHAHEAGILHRDIKPANILMKKRVPKIADFGLARPTGMSEAGGVIYGTPGYTAPEVLKNPDGVDQRADVYSVGVMLYELLTGEKPEGAYQAVHSHVDCDARLDKVVRKAINPNLKLRYSNAKEMADELDGILRDLGSGNPKAAAVQPKSNISLSVPGTRTPAGGAKLKTAAQPVAPASTLGAPAAGGQPPTAPQSVGAGGDSAIVRNIVIILILLVAIYIAQDLLSKRKEEVAAENERIRQEELAEKKLRDEVKSQQKTSTSSVSQKPKQVTKKPVELSKLEALAKLKDELATGRRPLRSMPKETFYLNSKSRMLLYVETPMTWLEADRWSREHGAYLATVRNSTDVANIAGNIPAGTQAWVGAGKSGRNSWSWSDGTPYSSELGLRKTSKLYYVSMGSDSLFELVSPQEKRPFVMEWRTDGTNPGGLVERMQAARQTLSQLDPSYPPGTNASGSRNFCLVREDVTFREARKLAKAAGGELFVPSDQVELAAVNELLAEALPKGELAFIGGERKGDKWKWVTGEQWKFANWEQNYPDDRPLLAVAGGESAGWRDVAYGEKLPYFLIEWSQDKAEFKPSGLAEASGKTNASFAALRKKAEELVADAQASREEKHAENIKRLEWDMDFYFKGLNSGEQDSQAKPMAEIKALFVGKGRLPDEIENQGGSAKVRGFTSYGIKKQRSIEKDFFSNIDKIRVAYIGQLKKVKAGLDQKGQVSASRAVQEEIDAASRSTEDFLSLFEN